MFGDKGVSSAKTTRLDKDDVTAIARAVFLMIKAVVEDNPMKSRSEGDDLPPPPDRGRLTGNNRSC